MASSGPNSGSTFTTAAAGGSADWSNPSNAAASDDTYSTVTVSGLGGQSRYLKVTGFGFSVPTGATIDGIVVEWETKASASASVYTDRARIVKGGTIGTTEKSLNEVWGTSDAYISYGSSTYLWGDTWTDSDINSADFGAAISAISGNSGPKTGYVDHVRITVYYTATAAGGLPFRPLRQSRSRSLITR